MHIAKCVTVLLLLSACQDVVSLLREASRVLALHDTNSDHRLDFEEFCMFISSFMDAAGYKLEDVLEELLTIAATKVGQHRMLHTVPIQVAAHSCHQLSNPCLHCVILLHLLIGWDRPAGASHVMNMSVRCSLHGLCFVTP